MNNIQTSGQTLQRGVSLIFALLALVALSLGAVALIRSVDSGVLALGNLSYKQSALSAGAQAEEAAETWLESQISTAGALDADSGGAGGNGYYSTDLASLDVTGRTVSSGKTVLAQVDWRDGNGCASGAPACFSASAPQTTTNGESVAYVITRLCSQTGAFNASGNNCATPFVSGQTNAAGKGSIDYSVPMSTGAASYSPYFRIITRTVGAKGTLSYTETLVHF